VRPVAFEIELDRTVGGYPDAGPRATARFLPPCLNGAFVKRGNAQHIEQLAMAGQRRSVIRRVAQWRKPARECDSPLG
jgi:hypothetical protein